MCSTTVQENITHDKCPPAGQEEEGGLHHGRSFVISYSNCTGKTNPIFKTNHFIQEIYVSPKSRSLLFWHFFHRQLSYHKTENSMNFSFRFQSSQLALVQCDVALSTARARLEAPHHYGLSARPGTAAYARTARPPGLYSPTTGRMATHGQLTGWRGHRS